MAIESLVQFGVDALLSNSKGEHPLEYCVERGSFDCFDKLAILKLDAEKELKEYDIRISEQFVKISKQS